MAQLRLALLLSDLSGGGAQRRMITVANCLAARGHAVDLVAIRGQGAFRAHVAPAVRVVALDPRWTRLPGVRRTKSGRVLAGVPAVAAYLRAARPDALLSSSNFANLAALWGRDLAGCDVPVVVTVNVHLTAATATLRRPFLRQLARNAYRRAERVIAVARSVAEDLRRLSGIPAERIVTIPNPVAAREIMARAEEPVAHPWLQPRQPAVVLGAGKLKPQKDFATLIRAFARLRAQVPSRLLILGEGEQRGRLEALARRLGVAADVELAGFVANPFPYMARAAVFVLSSRWEGFSNVLAEAMACGCPVASTDCPGGPAELLQDGRYGPLVAVGDVPGLAEALRALLDRPTERERLQARALQFSPEEISGRYLEVMCQARASAGGGRTAILH